MRSSSSPRLKQLTVISTQLVRTHSLHCLLDFLIFCPVTERPKHATELAKELDVSRFDALVLLSGDGLAHEVYQGFAAHSDPVKAFALPIAPVPTGSANGMALNLLGFAVRHFPCLCVN